MTAATPYRVRLQRTKGWRMPPNTVKVDRSTRWGNPFRVGQPPNEALARKWGWWPLPDRPGQPDDDVQTVLIFTLQLGMHLDVRALIRRELRGKNLACWCHHDERCHADVLLIIANQDVDNDVVSFPSRER